MIDYGSSDLFNSQTKKKGNISTLKYMNINDKDIIEAIDQLTIRFGEITIAFFKLAPFSNTKYEGFGSGFIVTFDGEHYLV